MKTEGALTPVVYPLEAKTRMTIKDPIKKYVSYGHDTPPSRLIHVDLGHYEPNYIMGYITSMVGGYFWLMLFRPVYDAWTEAHGPHSSNFCAGFIYGYNAAWNNIAANNQRVQQSTSQDSNVNIKGDNNRVTVNQQVNNNVGGQNGYGSDGHSVSNNGYQPRCAILCSIVKVN